MLHFWAAKTLSQSEITSSISSDVSENMWNNSYYDIDDLITGIRICSQPLLSLIYHSVLYSFNENSLHFEVDVAG